MNHFSFCFKDRHVAYLLIVIFIQQILSASSTLWVLRLSEDVALGRSFSGHLYLYLGSLMIPYLPTGIIGILLVRWEQSTIRRYLSLFVHAKMPSAALWSNRKKRDEFLSTANHESLQTINQTVSYYHGLVTSGFNAFLNIVAIGIFVDALFLYAYFFSVLASLLVIRTQSHRQKRLAEQAQGSRIDLGKSILSFWDNAVLGNAYNFRFWKQHADVRMQHAMDANVKASIFQEGVSIAISVVTFVPSLCIAVWGMHQHSHDPIALAAFVVIMSKLFLILSYTYDLLYWVVQLSAMVTKVKKILRLTTPEQALAASCASRIDWTSIRIQGEMEERESPSIAWIQERSRSPGRWTIQGRNGSGKTSLLLEMKQLLQEEAFYLPAQNQLDFATSSDGHSTGERLKQQLHEVEAAVEARVILLDEWNANLDRQNQEQLSLLIDRIAVKKCVIEVRHR